MSVWLVLIVLSADPYKHYDEIMFIKTPFLMYCEALGEEFKAAAGEIGAEVEYHCSDGVLA